MYLLHVTINHVQTQPGGLTVDATQILREMSHLSPTIYYNRPPGSHFNSLHFSVDSQTNNMKT